MSDGFFAGGYAEGLRGVRAQELANRQQALDEKRVGLAEKQADREAAAAFRAEIQANFDKVSGLLAEGAAAFTGTREEYLASDYARQIMEFATPLASALNMPTTMIAASVPQTLGDQRRADVGANVNAARDALGRDLTEDETAALAGLPASLGPMIVQLQDARDAAQALGDTRRVQEIDAQIARLGQSNAPQVTVSPIINTGDPNADIANTKFSEAAGGDDATRRSELLALATTAPEATFAVQRLVDIISDPTFETGPGTAAVVDLQNLAGSLGVDLNQISQGLFGKPTNQLTNAQEFRRLANNLALNLVAKMKGSLSDRELAFVQQGVAGLGSTTEANIKALSALLAAQEFIIDRAASVRGLDNTREAFLAFETDVSKRGADELTARAAEIEQMILDKRGATTTIQGASAEDLAQGLLDAIGQQ